MPAGVTITVDGSPDEELSSMVQSIDVIEELGHPTKYFLRISAYITQDGDIAPLTDGRIAPNTILGVIINDQDGDQCLVQGPVHGAELHLVDGGEHSYIDVIGSDISILLDRDTKLTAHDGATDSEVVQGILGSYGIDVVTKSTAAQRSEDRHVLVQRDTDLNFIRRLAYRNGFLAYVRTEVGGMPFAPDLTDTFYFEPLNLDAGSPVELRINHGSESNLETIDFEWDTERPTTVMGSQVDLMSLDMITTASDADVESFPDDIPLSQIQGGEVHSTTLVPPVDDAGDLLARREGALIEASYFLQATGSCNLHRVQRVLRAPSVVLLNGAGKRYSGHYIVERVHHMMTATAHQMDYTFIRNGWSE